MNSRQLQYAIKLAEVKSFSHVAELLNISQPALSKQILALENELGVRLFDRSNIPLTLTAAGERFIRDAKELLFREDQLIRAMEDFRSGEKGKLTIGVSPFRCVYLMPDITVKLRQKFPGLQVELREADSTQLHRGAAEGLYDITVMNLPVDEVMLDVIRLEPERLVLAVPKDMLGLLPNTESGDELPCIDLMDCGGLPFIVLGETQELRRLFDKMCSLAGFNPEIAAEVVGITTAWAMARSGVGATVLPLSFLQSGMMDDSLSFFALKQESSTRQPAVITRKGQQLSEYALYAIELLKQA